MVPSKKWTTFQLKSPLFSIWKQMHLFWRALSVLGEFECGKCIHTKKTSPLAQFALRSAHCAGVAVRAQPNQIASSVSCKHRQARQTDCSIPLLL